MKSAREALRYLQTVGETQPDGTISSGVIGIFPEGGIERPRETILPFMPGIGLLVHKSGARVLPVVIRGTPSSSTAWGSLLSRSRSSIEFLEPIDYTTRGMKAGEIAEDLRRLFVERTGWPTVEAIEKRHQET
jgi:1-acyl-sn-glycerol-3-phosphate acyltransferase